MADHPATAAPVATITIRVKLGNSSYWGREISLSSAQIAANDIEDGFHRGARLLLQSAFDLIDQAVADQAQPAGGDGKLPA